MGPRCDTSFLCTSWLLDAIQETHASYESYERVCISIEKHKGIRIKEFKTKKFKLICGANVTTKHLMSLLSDTRTLCVL